MTTSKVLNAFLQQRPVKMLIGGEWVEAASGKTFSSLNPATGEVLAEVAEGESEDINRAVAAARNAFESGAWPKMTPSQRGALLWKLADLLEQHAEEFAELETLDNGKPIKYARAVDVPLAVDHFRYFAGWATKLEGETIPVSIPNMFTYTLREPLGVIGQIIPWNFPLQMAAWKLAPALACGNTCVLKPAEQTPLSALRLGELICAAGFPEGVVNIVPGFGETAGSALAAHPDVDKIAFTGSTEVGRKIVQASAGNLKKVTLELGGKSPNIIFQDADLKYAIRGAMNAVFFNQGQVCTAGSRLFVHQSVYEQVVDGLCSYAQQMKIGPGISPDTELGPLVSEEQRQRVASYIERGKEEGATLLTGGKCPQSETLKGFFLQPTIFDHVHDDMTIAREEIFGPVVVALPFESVDELAARANKSMYGLAAGVWTNNIKIAHRMAATLKAGVVWVNTYNMFDAAAPFGGYKQSGYGREMGHAVLDAYTQLKTVWISTR
ncbi:aldehyde dehydrogenase (NAD+)/phenylacetaldehyde dehydrogenase [Thermosporothrix hazakensis]|jgi:acyl-CoA reductase-like NAD-dependent aldehyde dehydrogenase|uniref:Aldehyde dehydrogenase (NAD+)/phenylacetaldehyde dehydrogenase n=2 Tax=Thermosporothrix TaxID=768650 RepID=A0A326UER4_THEHA|nr:aldehyde dehydrogenase family protein [Thermosporothrix hazakensis]PZW36534.1 aldehyde dehydrogenase (NAD+)/phenylacetaldehyde dehydrogenase [Thermosporothrix hazakensis]BBH89001.1 putative aldehyde dehydrogenase DhaS [Thermosporothrix sp. COM3]GCE47185.1 putative aldehyde dehydrogenase DhaS [Thermosporothrix hazakensis]